MICGAQTEGYDIVCARLGMVKVRRVFGITMIRAVAVLFFLTFGAGQAFAQQLVWLQVEAQPTLRQAQDRVRSYDARLDNVAGFHLGNSWYGIVLGPFARPDAERLMRQLKAQRAIPGDSFISTGGNFAQQFWPIGIAAGSTAQRLTDDPEANDTVIELAPVQEPDETPQQARASERLLERSAREDLQIALKWAGFYSAAIDGAFGRGTRRAMGEWQSANNHEVTGVLTSAQREELMAAYNAVLEGMDLQLVRDDAAGIEIQIPTGVVAFSEYEPPFARFDPKGEIAAQVLLISQAGDQDRMLGLYEILQTLTIFPKEGPRSRGRNTFEIEGIGDGIHSYASVGLRNGQIKGFALIWPDGDEDRRKRILEEMQKSFAVIDGVLDPALALPDENQAIDLIAGLAVRKPKQSRSGFYIDAAGSVLTTTEVLGQCDEMTIDKEHKADVVHVDDALGIVVLRPQNELAPLSVAEFQTAMPRLQSEVAVAGYPYGGILTTPALTFGRLADIRGLRGEEELKRLSLRAQPGDAGGPVFDNGGAVLGMLLPRNDQGGQVLPEEVSFSLDSDQILASLEGAGIEAVRTDSLAFMDPAILTLRAARQTVLISCW